MCKFAGMIFRVQKGYYKRGKIFLHRLIWEANKGSIPKGHHIHHKDGNKLNNAIENLECLSHAEHLRLHMTENKDKIHAWHRSKKGRKFLGEKASKLMAERPFKKFNCPKCGKDFESQNSHRVKYCGINCQAAARRERGDDNEERKCLICNEIFIINRFQKTQTCGYKCGDKLRLLNRKEYEVPCAECGIMFLCNRPSVAKYCTNSCRQKFWKQSKRKP